MVMQRAVLTILLSAGLAAPASAQVKLVRKLAEGKSYSTELKSKVEQKLTIAGMEIDTNSDTKTLVKTSVGKRNDAGQVRVEEKVEGLQITIVNMGNEYMFDSGSPDNAGSSALEMLRPVHKAVSG